jgi:hypothetical protein
MGMLDFLFPGRKRTSLTQAAGTTGVTAMGGKLTTWENNQALQGRNLYLTLSNMIANTTIVGTGVRYYQNLLGGTSWTVEPKEDSGAEGEKACELVREGLFEANMPDQWSTCVKRASLYRMLGFSIHEWTMRRRPKDGKLVYNSIEHRPQSTIEFWDMPDKGGAFQGVVQVPLTWGDRYYVPRDRMLYCVDNSLTDSPDGVGLLRHVVEHSRRLGRFEQLEGFGYETDMRGIPVAKIPYRALEEYARANSKGAAWVAAQVAPLETLVANHVKTPWQGITFDSSTYKSSGTNGETISAVPEWALELLKGDGHGLTEINVVIERINREIARALGMEFLMLGGDGKGSLALSKDKTSMFASILEASLHELAWFTVHDLVYPLLELNGMDPEMVCPQVMPDPIATERIETVVDALSKLATAGAVLMPDDPAINQIRRRLHLAEQPDLPPDILGTLPRSRQPALQPPDPNDDGSVDVDVSDIGDDTKGKNTKPRAAQRTTKSTFRQESLDVDTSKADAFRKAFADHGMQLVEAAAGWYLFGKTPGSGVDTLGPFKDPMEAALMYGAHVAKAK